MLKIFFSIILSLFLSYPIFAQEKARIYPPQGLLTYQGLDDTSSESLTKDGHATEIQNITLDITGSALKRKGYSWYVTLDTDYGGDSFEPVTGLYEFYKSDGIRTKIAAAGSKLFKIGANSKTVYTPVITKGQNYQFVWTTALDYAIGTNNYDSILKINDTSASNLLFTGLTYPVTKAKCVVWWKNYLIFGNTVENGVLYTTRIRWSSVGTIETWSNTDYVDIETFGGQEIEGFGVLYDNLYVFLTDSIYKVSLVGGEELIVVTKISNNIGCITKNSIQNVQIGNNEGIIFLSRDKTINYCDGIKISEISTLISGVMDNLSTSRLPYAVSINDRENAHYYLAVSDGRASTNNLLLDFNYAIGEWSKHTQIDANAFMIANDANSKPQIYYGNYRSFVYQMNDEDKNNDVAGETGIFDTVGTTSYTTESGLFVILYDTGADFSDVTGAIVTITSGTGLDTESVICDITATGIVVVDTGFTGTTSSGYSIGAIESIYATKWYDVGDPVRIKNFAELFFWTMSLDNADLTVSYAADFTDTLSHSTVSTIDLDNDSAIWGTAVWGTDI